MKNSSSLFICAVASLFLVHGQAWAQRGFFNDGDANHAVHGFRPLSAGAPRQQQPHAQVFQCGDTVTASASLAADLNCPLTTGFALNVIGSNITVNGNGHKIVAPLAAAGLFVQGSNISVSNFQISGVLAGDGILAYEAPNVQIVNNTVSGNEQGIMIYSDTNPLTGAQILNNVAENNSLFGIRTGFDSPGAIVSPNIAGNNLSNSGSYGLLVEATQFDLGSGQPNIYAGSLNGIYLTGLNANIHDLTLSQDKIQNISIFAASLQGLTISNVDASSLVPANAQQGRIGADLYRVASFSVNGLNCTGNDVGIKLETELGASPGGTITGSKFWSNDVSGILLVSYDGTPYGLLDFFKNCFQTPTGAFRVYEEPGFSDLTGSSLDDGLNVCSSTGGGAGPKGSDGQGGNQGGQGGYGQGGNCGGGGGGGQGQGDR